jgi:hypothetical protein
MSAGLSGESNKMLELSTSVDSSLRSLFLIAVWKSSMILLIAALSWTVVTCLPM